MAHPDTPEAVDAPATLTMADAAAAFDDFDQDENLEQETEADPDNSAEDGEDLEVDAEGEQDDDADEPEEVIAPPVSLTADEKQVFAQLPPEAQQAWAASESRRNQQVQEATTKASERERIATTAVERATADADTRRAAQLKAFMDVYRPQMPDPQLASVNPAAYIAQEAQYRAETAQFEEIEQQIAAIERAAGQKLADLDEQSRVSDLMTVPQIADPATRDAFLKSSLEIVQALGFDTNEFEQTAGSADFKALSNIAEWKSKAGELDRIRSRQMQKVRAAKGKTLRPAAAQSGDSSTSRASQRAYEAFRSNPSSRAAAAAVFND
jgi:hypothetical protein